VLALWLKFGFIVDNSISSRDSTSQLQRNLVIQAIGKNLTEQKILVTKHQQVVATGVTFFRRFYVKYAMLLID